MAKKKRAINFKAFADDVKEGMTDSDLMGKYTLSHTQLDRVFEKLLDAGRLQLADIEGRGSGFEATVQVAFTCASCGALKFFDSSKCPECGYDDSASGAGRKLSPPSPKNKRVPKRSSRELREETTRVEAAVEAAISAKLDQAQAPPQPVEIEEPELDQAAEEAELDFKDALDAPTPPPAEPIEPPEPPKQSAREKKKKKKKDVAAEAAPKKAKGRGKRLALLIAAELLFAVVVLAAVAYFTDMLPIPEGWLPGDRPAKRTEAFKRSGVERQRARLAKVDNRQAEQQGRAAAVQQAQTAPKAQNPHPKPEPQTQPTGVPESVSGTVAVEKPQSLARPPQDREPSIPQEPQRAPNVEQQPPAAVVKEHPDAVTEQTAEPPVKKRDVIPGPIAQGPKPPDKESIPPESTEQALPAEKDQALKAEEKPEQQQLPKPVEPANSEPTVESAVRLDQETQPEPGSRTGMERMRPDQASESAPNKQPGAPPTGEVGQQPEKPSEKLAHARPVQPALPEGKESQSRGKTPHATGPEKTPTITAQRMPSLNLNKALVTAIDQGDVEAVRDLLAAGANPRTVDGNGVPILIKAAVSGNVAMAELLLSKGAEVNAGDSKGNTPLMIAAGTGNLELVKILLNNGADVDIRNSRGVTALGWAYSPTSDLVSLKDQRSVVKLLKEHGRRNR